jgi:hypothetical protein
MTIVSSISRELRAGRGLFAAVTAAIFLGYHAAQLALMVLRFGALPNYVTFSDWPGNVARIARSTPSVIDMATIIPDEWLVEIGRMNYGYGHGISEWSFVLMPAKLAVVLLIGMLVATNIILIRAVRRSCKIQPFGETGAATAATLAAGMTSVTMTWVVCCAAPSWTVGLSVMGLSVTTALAVAPMGPWLSLAAVAVLAMLPFLLARRLSGAASERWHSAAGGRASSSGERAGRAAVDETPTPQAVGAPP